MAAGVQDEPVVVAPPALADLATLEHGVVDAAIDQLVRDRQTGRSGADHQDGSLTPAVHDGLLDS